jgi:hypothetical protein
MRWAPSLRHGRGEQLHRLLLRLDPRCQLGRWRDERSSRVACRRRARWEVCRAGAAPGGARLVLGSGLAVLEPVEDVGVADGAVLLQAEADARDLVARRVHHAGVEDGLQDSDLLRPRVPPRLGIRGPLLAAYKSRNQSSVSP